ncbi:PH domain-like protein [Xylariaceae sp. FL0594]|nr:PH domain-like protein [Xylariaceae sp. FL0594]
MANTPSTEPFKMRIPSPDPELSGEVVAKSIPDDPSRKNKYADEIFGPLCPPGYDEQQRRQWFCVLDLRRLKYAADEIFAQKDWKLNILNFAKEYEKSRGLIMLRYGLYEFKNVKPSSEVLKRWRAAHNLPDLEDNSQTVPSTGSMKRKADGDLTPNDNPLMNSTANQNKRRNVDQVANDPFSASPAQFKKSKRKQTSNANTQSPSVSFGASTTSGVGVSFGSSSFQANGNEPKKIEFQFTSSAPTASSTPFTFGQGSSPASGFSSPFPVPSSMGTTPVNGTPEPQGPNENGEEPPQQQISLTEGGPGEEDETILHEVRAKAIMFVPVQKDEDDEDTKKSPWSTKGVGPLRILKNKTTGTVRMLLRAEPRGHIALNKALLPDVEYTARDKTINFAAANDSGSGLETWVLQVKKPEFARELVKVLESNKSANRK